MPGSNSSELTTSSHNEKSDALKSETNQDCPNCNDDTKVNKKLLATELRIQMIKEKILAKLQLDREPVLAQNLTELKFSTVLSNLNLIEDKNEPIHNGEEYYAKTTQIIVFSEEDPLPLSQMKGNLSKRLPVHFKLDKHSLPSSVSSASMWIHTRMKIELEGRFLHVAAIDQKTVKETGEVQDINIAKFKVKEENFNRSDWLVVDIKDIVQHWFNKTSPTHFSTTQKPIHGLGILCPDCERDTSQLISFRGQLRPFIVIDLDKPKAPNRRKRQPIDCNARRPPTECCRRKLYVNFALIGWHWVIHPKGFSANYCDGRCGRVSAPLKRPNVGQNTTFPLRKTVPMCCSPSKLSGFSILFYDDTNPNGIVKADLNDMTVDACDCF